MADALKRHDEVLRAAIEGSGGYVFKTVGDAFCATFPTAKEAVQAAETAQRALVVEPWPASTVLRVRMALHTGECEERDGDYFGPAVNRLARLEATAHGGQVVLSRATADIVGDRLPPGVGLRHLGTHHLKDLGRPEEVFQLEMEGLDTEFPPLRSLDNPKLVHNLPELVSSFVGRETEVIEVSKLIEASRLVTLTGAGGSGKTRLALQVAADALDDFADGVWLVELASLADPELVTSATASALGVREEPGRSLSETLVDAASDRHLLLVLDNCEHLLDATAALVDALVRSCPRLRVLATSREPLAIDGERAYRVPSLTLPGPDQVLNPDGARSFDALHLFADRAVGHRADFVLDETNAATVASLCRKLDGMPLAIELATARLGSLSVADIEQRLDDRFGLLTRGARTALPRQQTLQGLIDWSYDLLNENEQTVLCQLSVFAGGWTLEAAEAVCSGEDLNAWEVSDILGSLVDKSLVQAEPMGSNLRYRLLETIRQYAAERLSERGEDDSVRKDHAEFFLELVEATAPHIRGFEQRMWLERLEAEHDNLREAVAHFIFRARAAEQALRIAVALRDFWILCGHLTEGIDAVERALELAGNDCSPALRAGALIASGWLNSEITDFEPAETQLTEGLELAKTLGKPALALTALLELTWIARWQGNFKRAIQLAQECVISAEITKNPSFVAYAHMNRGVMVQVVDPVGARRDLDNALSESANNPDLSAQILGHLGYLDLIEGDLVSARHNLDNSVSGLVEAKNIRLVAPQLAKLGLVNLLEGDLDSARDAFLDALAFARRMGVGIDISLALLGLAGCASRAFENDHSAKLHGAASKLIDETRVVMDQAVDQISEADCQRLRRKMGVKAFDSAYQAGRELALHEAIELALQEI